MHERINMAFHVRTRNGRYTENMKCETNVAFDHKNEIIDRKDELHDRRNELHDRRDELLDRKNKIKQNMIVSRSSEENECEYVTPTGAVCLTSTSNITREKQVEKCCIFYNCRNENMGTD